MQTFNLIPTSQRQSTGEPQNHSPETTLLPLWVSYLQDKSGDESSLYCTGDCVDIVQQYIGRSDVVDAAVFAVIAGAGAFRTGKDEDIAAAHEANIAALQELRSSLSSDCHGADSAGALVATKLLCFAEVCI